MWEFYNFAATQIISEIKFWWIQKAKNVIFGILRGSKFEF